MALKKSTIAGIEIELEEGRRYLLIGLDMGCEDPDHVRSLLEREDDAAP